MPQLRSMIAAGLHTTAANAIQGAANVATAVSAAGATQGTATLLTADINLVTTVAASTGVLLSATADIGDEFLVINGQGTNALLVYPPVGGAINGLATNTGYSLAVNKGVRLVRASSTVWIAVGA